MKKNSINFIFLFLSVLAIMIVPVFILSAQNKDLLTQEEILWLASRNNTIVVYPEKNFAPFSYQSSSGFPQGLSIDFIELIAEILDIKVEYLPARPLTQILEDAKNGKGDIITSLAPTSERENFLYFTDSYINVSTVIITRKDFKVGKGLNLSDLTGKKVAVGRGYAVSEFLKENYPRIILDYVSDDEVALQQLVLGEVDFAIMDIASLSFYLSKQVLSSVNIVGNVGFSYDLSFAIPKDKQILQSILDKGLTQVSKNDRDILKEKWVVTPEERENDFWAIVGATLTNDIFQYNFFLFTIFILFIVFMKHKETYKGHYQRFLKKKEDVKEVEEEVDKLEKMSDMLKHELDNIKEAENKLKDKLDSIEK